MGQWLAKLSLQELGPSYVDPFFGFLLLVYDMLTPHSIQVTTTDLTFSLLTCTTIAFNS
jgi:hypothetical protein